MRIVYERAAVRVPATTTNMGPGFDPFGMAFRYYDEVSVQSITGTTHVTVEGVDAETVPTDDDNLVAWALRAGLDAVGAPQTGFGMRCVSRIPHDEGMGSSTNAAVVGLVLTHGLIVGPEALSDDQVFALTIDFKDHPDNVAPTVFGGTTVAWVERGGRPCMAPVPLNAFLGVNLLIPSATTRLSTKEARQVPPVSVPHEDALFNTSRATVLMLVLARRPDLLMAGAKDRLHQRYRRGILPTSIAVMDSLCEQGYPTVISGTGPTVLVLSVLADQTRFALENHGWNMLSPGVNTRGAVLTS